MRWSRRFANDSRLCHQRLAPNSSPSSGSQTSTAPIGTWRRGPLGELLIDLEEDRAARAVVFGLLAEMERK
jgi:hypothetical protein